MTSELTPEIFWYRLRYLHAALVRDLIQTRTDKKGQPIFQEIAEEWFDPDRPKAEDFIWP